MHSLRGRIASSYALLLIAVIVALGILITLRFEYILRAQAQARIVSTLQDIARATAAGPNTFGLAEGDPLLTLGNPDNLERWASTSTLIEVDDLRGYPLAKSFNMGPIATFGPAQVTFEHPFSTREITVGNRPFLVGATILTSGNEGVIVQVAQPLDQLYQAFRQTEASIAIILLVAALAVAGTSYYLANEITAPINRLAQAMREIGSEGLSRRLRWRGRQDEVGALAQAFDDLLARLEEAFARERQFISDASHELKTPLTSINANAQMLVRWGDRDQTIRTESLQTIIGESASLAEMVNGMLTLAKADSGEAIPKEPVSLASAAREAVNTTAQRAQEKGLSLDLETPAPAPIVEGDAALLRQLLTNLIDNAIKFTPQGGVTVRVYSGQGEGIAEVADTGPGIDPDDLPYIFDRFYRTDKSRSRTVPGTGLGLAIARSVARIHGGTIEAERPSSGGTLFRVRLPEIH
ncbi:MAG TPA: HAMP domain-containing sensor histidine kinase [Candidatus Baltobacteraceae bacterium]|jgi:signal transduction histidine kinase|nr:HAMP domain-containing sensor histidine kinase [Candidatus Baltobacteraceae bacterium]